MCGIAGGIGHRLLPGEAGKILQRLAHRGPDDHGIFEADHIWLLNTRLAIRDTSEEGHQPMTSANGRYTIVYNGELYNNAGLREQLTAIGTVFKSDCDTETLLYAFSHWGADCLERLNGDFAFAVYDAENGEVFIARDRMGVKPLYYYAEAGKLLFASELKALAAVSGIDKTISPDALFQYLLFQYAPSDTTPFKQIRKLLPGHFIRINLQHPVKAAPQRYYSLPFSGVYSTAPESALVNELDHLMTASVNRQLASDRPVGLFLSGGLDSSLIAAITRRLNKDKPLKAFTIRDDGDFAQEGFIADEPFARRAARYLDIDLCYVQSSFDLSTQLDELIWRLDEPQADPAAIHVGSIAAAASKLDIPVLLSGAGGDDVFSGYRRHVALSYARMLSLTPRGLGAIPGMLPEIFRQSSFVRRVSKLVATAGMSQPQAMIAHHFWAQPAQIQSLFNPGVLHRQDPFAAMLALLDEIPDEHNSLNRALTLELRSFLPQHNLAYTDKMSMAHSVETRVPFLDNDLVAFSASLPPVMKMRGATTKHILRQIARRYLPDEIIHRKKTGFGAPLRSWMRAGGHQLARQRLLDASFLNRGLFNGERLELFISENEQQKTDGAYTLFSLLCIESWLRQFAPIA